MPTSMPRRLLIKIAEDIYRKYQTAPYEGFSPDQFVIATREVEPGVRPEDYFEGIKQIQQHVKSIKKFRYRPDAHGATHSIREDGHLMPIDLTVDPETFNADILKFIKNAYEKDRLISRDEDGIFWFRANGEMKPKVRDSKYWRIFESIYEVAMRGAEDENHYFLAKYKPLRAALVKRKVIMRFSTSEDTYHQKLRNFVKDQFKKRPQSFGLPQAALKGRDIISIEEGTGVKLYNPEI